MMRVGLNGYGDIPTGLGQLNARFWRKLDFESRSVVRHKRFSLGKTHLTPLTGNREIILLNNHAEALPWLKKIDVLFFVERPFPAELPLRAKSFDKRVVCMPMVEWLPKGLEWLPYVDLFIAPTDQALEHCQSIGLGDKTIRLQCPLDLDEFPFRKRENVNSIVYCDGWGGVNERKGRPEVDALMRTHPSLPVRIKSQRRGSSVLNSAELYTDADAVLVPGRYDGLGLTLLEAMASGCPVIATKAAPYEEFLEKAYREDAINLEIPVVRTENVQIWRHKWPANIASIEGMKDNIGDLMAAPPSIVSRLSQAGRDYIEREHGEAAWAKLWEAITS